MSPLSRRRFLAASTGLALAGLAAPAAALAPTPRQSAGPFYPVTKPEDDDSDLTRVVGADGPAKGRHTELTGRLLDAAGRPVAATRIEIWQCDANGRYGHPREKRDVPADPGFQGFGHVVTAGDGGYRFRTIRPVPYPGRTPHIHVAVFPAGGQPFVTQLYVAGEPRNESDFLYRHVAAERRHLVTAEFTSAGTGDLLQARWDIILGATPA